MAINGNNPSTKNTNALLGTSFTNAKQLAAIKDPIRYPAKSSNSHEVNAKSSEIRWPPVGLDHAPPWLDPPEKASLKRPSKAIHHPCPALQKVSMSLQLIPISKQKKNPFYPPFILYFSHNQIYEKRES
jgi:hypothetical protein